MQQSQSRSLVDWLSYLEQIHPVNIDMGLERVGAVARRMGLTQLPFKVITVAGTNGKGSSCAMAASILMAAGYKVGVYSSPHLLRFTERVRVNGQELADGDQPGALAQLARQRGQRLEAGLQRQVAGHLAVGGEVARADAGALDDPVVRALDAVRRQAGDQVSVAQAMRGQRTAGAGNARMAGCGGGHAA